MPVSWLPFNHRSFKFTNWPDSAGMGPGIYKTQSKHTKNKSLYSTGAKRHKECKHTPSYWMHVRDKRDGGPVSWFSCKKKLCNLTNRPNSAGMGPGAYKTRSKHTTNKSPYPTGRKWHMENKSLPSYWTHVQREKKDGVPVSWLSCKCSASKFVNWPNAAGMGPGGYKTQSKHTTNK